MTGIEINIVTGDRSVSDNGIVLWDNGIYETSLLTARDALSDESVNELHKQLDVLINRIKQNMGKGDKRRLQQVSDKEISEDIYEMMDIKGM